MFEHRLGLALGMTLGQVRSLSNEEYRSWRAYYQLEPFGWQNQEYQTAAIIAMIHNVNAKKAKKVSDFMRDPERSIREHDSQTDQREKWKNASKEERLAMLRGSMGNLGVKTKDGGAS